MWGLTWRSVVSCVLFGSLETFLYRHSTTWRDKAPGTFLYRHTCSHQLSLQVLYAFAFVFKCSQPKTIPSPMWWKTRLAKIVRAPTCHPFWGGNHRREVVASVQDYLIVTYMCMYMLMRAVANLSLPPWSYVATWCLYIKFIAKHMVFYPQKVDFWPFGGVFCNFWKICHGISQYDVPILKSDPNFGGPYFIPFIRISNRLAIISKWVIQSSSFHTRPPSVNSIPWVWQHSCQTKNRYDIAGVWNNQV